MDRSFLRYCSSLREDVLGSPLFSYCVMCIWGFTKPFLLQFEKYTSDFQPGELEGSPFPTSGDSLQGGTENAFSSSGNPEPFTLDGFFLFRLELEQDSLQSCCRKTPS